MTLNRRFNNWCRQYKSTGPSRLVSTVQVHSLKCSSQPEYRYSQYLCHAMMSIWTPINSVVSGHSIPAYTISQIHYMLSHLIFVWLEVKCTRLRCSKQMKGPLELTQCWLCRRCHMITASEIFGIWTSSLAHSDHFALRSKTNGSSNPTPARRWRWVLLHTSNGQLAVSRSWHQQLVCVPCRRCRASLGGDQWDDDIKLNWQTPRGNMKNGVGGSHLPLTDTVFRHVKLGEITWVAFILIIGAFVQSITDLGSEY